MAPELEAGVERRLESPQEDATVRLIVEVTTQTEGVREQLESVTVTVHDELPLNCYSVTIREEELPRLCELEAVNRVELDSEATVFSNTKDFRYPTG